MTTLKGRDLDDKINSFMSRKAKKFPELKKQQFSAEDFTIAEIFSTRYISFGKRVSGQY